MIKLFKNETKENDQEVEVQLDDSPEIFNLEDKWFEIFNTEVDYWVNYFGLLEWEVHTEFEDDQSLLGWCSTQQESRICVIGLNKTWNEEPTEYRVKQIAFHETCELLLSELRMATYERFHMDENHIDRVTHSVIRRLENTIFKKQCKCGGKCGTANLS